MDLGVLLSALNFVEIEVKEKFVRRQGASWTFRALRTDDLEIVQGAYEQGGQEVEVQAILETRRRGARHATTPLAPERRIQYNAQQGDVSCNVTRCDAQGSGEQWDDPWAGRITSGTWISMLKKL